MEFENNSLNDTGVNKTRYIGSLYQLSKDDSSWVISNAFIIFTMQTGTVI